LKIGKQKRNRCKLLECQKEVLHYQKVTKAECSTPLGIALKELPIFVHVSFSYCDKNKQSLRNKRQRLLSFD
jgi:hypothetical protein